MQNITKTRLYTNIRDISGSELIRKYEKDGF